MEYSTSSSPWDSGTRVRNYNQQLTTDGDRKEHPCQPLLAMLVWRKSCRHERLDLQGLLQAGLRRRPDKSAPALG
jgi:hypothetical protein